MSDTTDAAAIFAPLWRRKWIILLVGVLVAGASYAYYKRQPAVYSATTQLNLASGSEEQGLVGNASKAPIGKAQILNSATIITSATVAEEAHKLLRAESGNVKGKVRVKTNAAGSDIVTISAEAKGAKRAARLANAYAVSFIRHQQAAYRRSVKAAIRRTKAQLHRIELSSAGGKGKGQSSGGSALVQAAALNSKLNQLESSLSVSGIQQISPAKAKTAELIEPKPKSNAIFGFAIGIVLAMIGVFIVERFDHSLRGLAGVENALGVPILAALPSVRNPVVDDGGRRRPAKPLIEPLRRIHTTLAMRASAGAVEPRVILITSPESGDGKSSLAATLALVKRDAGERVAVVEADFRRPVIARLLGVSGERGLADVLSGALRLDEAMQAVPGVAAEGAAEAAPAAIGSTLTRTRLGGSVSVLAAGPAPSGVPPMVGPGFAGIVAAIAEEHDCVLIDAPSPLESSDTLQLLSSVDGTLLVARLGHTRDVSAERLAEMLQTPGAAPVLGSVANDVPARELARSGFTTGRRGRSRSLLRR
jgi:Mrp family chromosome partitioning ATPase